MGQGHSRCQYQAGLKRWNPHSIIQLPRAGWNRQEKILEKSLGAPLFCVVFLRTVSISTSMADIDTQSHANLLSQAWVV